MPSGHSMFLFEAAMWRIIEELFLTISNWFCEISEEMESPSSNNSNALWKTFYGRFTGKCVTV